MLLRPPPGERFQPFTVLSAEHGLLHCLRRLTTRSASTSAALDLFDEVDLYLTSSSQGRTWFVQEARVLLRHAAIGRSYDALRLASRLAAIIARNPVPDDGRPRVCELLRQAFRSFDTAARPDIVYLKALYCFARDEGYPVKQEWWQGLSADDQGSASNLLNQPVSAQTAAPPVAARLTRLLEDYLRAQTDILLE